MTLEENNTNGGVHSTLNTSPSLTSDMVACEQCGKPEHKTKLRKKRYCSPSCARLAKTTATTIATAVAGMGASAVEQHQQSIPVTISTTVPVTTLTSMATTTTPIAPTILHPMAINDIGVGGGSSSLLTDPHPTTLLQQQHLSHPHLSGNSGTSDLQQQQHNMTATVAVPPTAAAQAAALLSLNATAADPNSTVLGISGSANVVGSMQPNLVNTAANFVGNFGTMNPAGNEAIMQSGTAAGAVVNAATLMTAPLLNTAEATVIPQMANWSVADVCEFIKSLPGCNDYVDDFEQQEIDGQALLLLKENHLVNAMGMKLGPALKIVAKVESMKESMSTAMATAAAAAAAVAAAAAATAAANSTDNVNSTNNLNASNL